MHPPRSAAVLAAVLAVAAPVPASAGCTGPRLDAPAQVAAGQRITVTGGGFHDGCDDTGTAPVGCRAGEPASDVVPYDDVQLVVVAGDRTTVLGTVDADADGDVRWEVQLPVDLPPGEAVLGAGRAERVVQVR